MRHLVCLLEEPSAQDALQAWLPTWLPDDVTPHFIVFQGKQDLEKRMVLRIRYWLQPDSRFLVLRDQDSGDCKVVKAGLAARCVEAGRPDAVVRVACRELESFFVGDWHAVANAFGKPALTRLARKARYRDPGTATLMAWVHPARNWSSTCRVIKSATARGASPRLSIQRATPRAVSMHCKSQCWHWAQHEDPRQGHRQLTLRPAATPLTAVAKRHAIASALLAKEPREPALDDDPGQRQHVEFVRRLRRGRRRRQGGVCVSRSGG